VSTFGPRRRRRWLAIIGLAVLGLLGVGFAILRLEFEGPALADKISTTLNKRMRGRIEIGSVEWPTSALKQALTGGWVPVTMRDVRVWDDCALDTGASAVDEIRWGDPNEDCTRDDRPDPDPASKRRPRKLLLRTALITGEVDAHALMFGNHDLVFRNVWVHGGEALLEQTREPYPLHAYDRTIVSLVTAFYPRMKAGYRAGIFADPPPPIFDLRDIHVKGLNLTVHITPGPSSGKTASYTTARFEGVDVDAGPSPKNDSYLYVDGVDPLVAKFYVRLEATAQRGTIRWEDRGAREAFRLPVEGAETYPPPGRDAAYEIALADVKVHRLAQLPTEWARKDYVAKTLELDVEARTLPCRGIEPATPGQDSEGAHLHVTGELFNYWDRPYDGSWNLVVDGKNLGPTIRTCIKSTVGGDSLDGTITLSGPFVAPPKIGLSMHNLDFDVPLRAGEDPLRLTLAEVQGSIDLVNDQGSIDRTTALIRGGQEPGEVMVAATFGLAPYNARTHVEITKAIDIGRFLPPTAKPIGGFLQGRLTASGDVDVGFALEDFDLALGRTPKERSIRVHRGRLFTDNEFDSINIQQVMVEAGRSRARVNGLVDVERDELDVTIEGNFPDLDVWLKRFGLPAFVKSAGGGVIKIKGPITSPTINVATELGGVPCLDKVRIVDSQYNSDTRILEIRELRSSAFGGTLKGNARLHLPDKGRTRIERLRVEGRKLDAAKICGLGQRLKGTIDSVDAELSGTIDPERTAVDWLALAKLQAQASRLVIDRDRFTGVGLCINRKDDRACRPRVGYLDHDDLAQCEQGKRNGFCAVATATREGGGSIDATIAHLAGTRTGRTTTPARLGGTVALSDVPVGIVEGLLGGPVQTQAEGAGMTAPSMGGLASATLHLTGSPDAPQAYGAIHLLRSWVAGSFIGDTQLAVEPATIGGKAGISFKGRALAGRVQLGGTLITQAPYPAELVISGRRIELDALIDLPQRFGLTVPVGVWASGTMTVKTELGRPTAPEAWLELHELSGTITHRSADGRLTPVRLEAVRQRKDRPAVSLHITPSSIDFKCRDKTGAVDCTTRLAVGALFGKPAGEIDFRGHVAPRHMAIEAVGKLDLAPIAPLVGSLFSAVTGTADVNASISGTFEKPSYEASLLLRKVAVRPTGGDTWLSAPSGLIKLANGSLGFTNVRVRVLDRHPDDAIVDESGGIKAPDAAPRPGTLDETGELSVKGLITLDGLTPAAWNVLVDGKVAGKMLLVAMPELISQASGLARIEGSLLLGGTGPRPNVSGTLVFDDPVCGTRGAPVEHCRKPSEQPRSITVKPRGLRREIAVSRGSVEIATRTTGDRRTYDLSINGLTATIDGEGTLHDVNGYAELDDGELAQLELDLKADAIPFRTPGGQLDLVVSTSKQGISISKPNVHASLSVRGDLSIVDGTYRQDFEIAEGIRALGTNSPDAIPFWEVYPTIGNALLELGIEVNKFNLRSNIAQIELSGRRVALAGTPREPRLDGQISVDRGRFRLPGMRAEFKNTAGTINFNRSQPAGNPALEIRSEADYRDLTGQDHVITLRIIGTVDSLSWDLTTSTGYNKSQTVSLLLLGRNPEQLRRSLGDQSLGSDPTVVDPSTNPSQGFADQIVRDLAGDWVSDLLENSLTKLTELDVLRIQVGFGSIGLQVEKRLLDAINLVGTTEQTIRGNTINFRGEIRMPYQVTTGQPLVLQGGFLNKNFNDPAEQDIRDVSGKLVFRLFIP
jgi:hypothetical protein